MDSLKHPNSKLHNHLLSHKSKILTSIKFLLCFSLLCILFSSLPLLLQSLKPFLMQFFSYMVEKSYMFLLCNGLLLVLIAINSAPINASPPPTTHQSIEEKSSRLESKDKESDIAVAAPIAIAGEETTESPQEEEEEEEKILEIVEQEDEEENALAIIDEDEHELGVDDIEELNRKCEDFIKRMKATFSSNNLKLRADYSFYFDNNQRSLVAVN